MAFSASSKREVGECQQLDVNQFEVDNFMSESIEKFNNDLYRLVTCSEGGNFTMSGLSVYLALSMSSLGAKGSTEKEMHDALYLGGRSSHLLNIKDVISYFHEVKDVTLDIANRIYVDKNIVVKETFKSDVEKIFHSDVKNVDFHSETEKTVNDINQWCSEQTNYKIGHIISKDDITSLTSLILLNAVYFKARWQEEFKAHLTQFQPFYVSKTEMINVLTMHRRERLMYKHLTELNAECVALQYEDPNFLFIVIKPKEIDGLKYLEENLDKIDLNYEDFERQNIDLALPKFKIESTVNLQKYLEKLGMVVMFTEEANFKGISEEPVVFPPLHVDNVLQKAFIEVNEKTTEAYAVTCMMKRCGGCGPRIQWREFKVDRPFLYRIVNKCCNLTLFNGRVIKPTYT